ncbi:MAG: trypsin-like serine peptidase, partial [Candidatus Competibacterales bacterium]
MSLFHTLPMGNKVERGARRSQWSSVFILILVLLVVSTASGRQGTPPLSQTKTLLPDIQLPVILLPAVDIQKLLTEDLAKDNTPGPIRFARPDTVHLTPQQHGVWEMADDGSQIWRLKLSAPGATDLNIGFGRYRLPKGATLHLISTAAGTDGYYEGPYDATDNQPHGELWTPVIPGDEAVIEVSVPADFDGEHLDLVVSQVGAGYLDIFNAHPTVSVGKQGSCNIDTICPEGDPWSDEIRSVAAIGFEGSQFCTATLVMNGNRDFRPYLLTAHHCAINAENAASVVTYWNYESPTCGQFAGGSLAENQTGAIWRAGRADVDMTLIELSARPDDSFEVHYAGWDSTGQTPSGSVGIHHPSRSEKAISFNDDPLISTSSCILFNGTPDTHWEMDWELGTTEPGSSGSAIWDFDGRIVGFLSGGSASCTNPSGTDCYGKVSAAWDGPNPSSRLRDWLDPSNNTPIIDGADPLSVDGPFPRNFPPSPVCNANATVLSN